MITNTIWGVPYSVYTLEYKTLQNPILIFEAPYIRYILCASRSFTRRSGGIHPFNLWPHLQMRSYRFRLVALGLRHENP